MYKNVASQKLIVFAFDSTTNLPKTGDAANLTAYVSKDYGSVTVLGDTSATEMDSTNAKGYYLFDLTQSETNADTLLFSAKSSTSNIVVIGVPATVFTEPNNFHALAITSGGIVQADLQTIKTQTVTCSAGVTVNVQVGSSQALSFNANNFLKVSLNDILATTLTETSGQLAGGFKKFFNIASPASTMDALTLVATATTLTNAPSDSSGVTTLLSRVSSARAGYLDNINNANILNIPSSPAATGAAMTLTSAYDFSKGSVAMAESYASDGAAPTPVQALFAIQQFQQEKAKSGTTLLIKKLDGTTTAMTFTLDSGSAPTSVTRSG